MITGLGNIARKATIAVALGMLALTQMAPAHAQSRIKDIADFEGVRDNMLVGYGLVVGLNGTGDDLGDAEFTRQSMVAMLERLGINVRDQIEDIDSDNIAAVMVTATLPPFSRQGSRIDVSISAIGTSESLQGGTLLVTPMVGADGEVYAVAQGNLAVGGFSAGGNAETVVKGVPTSARIASGGIVEREIDFNLNSMQDMSVVLRNPDFTTARRVSDAINAYLGQVAARASDPGTVRLVIPDSYNQDVVALLTDIEQLRVEPDQIARVVIDENTGTIVMGENVRINRVAIAQGNLTIRVTETPQVSQPSPFSQGGNTEVVDRTNIEVDEGEDNQLGVLNSGVSLQELVNGLNSLGVGPRDMITILQAIKTSGALQAEIEVM
ncbi:MULTISPECIES: flagellar basal body P-ring protein FlgI [Thalassospira]|mgnify:FL=1|jgi:flagellar P-ring protein precursor FlgI|uniref:Flagellar P-ring protein n=5 Tax=Thalassospira TaxID=168934 RepID=A0A2N3L5Z3_9PROT|nr:MULTISPECIES: flagellar basal body P-ring protein FlgI [Thalassospira]PKR58235.1 flagellar basal body P-ring protein FlgI [Thalassospira lohafexi]RCK29294.1 flagellar basal body P-ring biosynthesis protein FlgA [Thalassospira lucentensis MCCC 1A00383 = DSM 14000]|tara:strand:+ start:42621 stop:43763 length:1143 start_codon:yes stop_codon:yes gene_type:complete